VASEAGWGVCRSASDWPSREAIEALILAVEYELCNK